REEAPQQPRAAAQLHPEERQPEPREAGQGGRAELADHPEVLVERDRARDGAERHHPPPAEPDEPEDDGEQGERNDDTRPERAQAGTPIVRRSGGGGAPSPPGPSGG